MVTRNLASLQILPPLKHGFPAGFNCRDKTGAASIRRPFPISPHGIGEEYHRQP
ncbi:hypothetical protein Q0601_18175 [Paracoccus onubensis]|uniref:hypothetical protein n=1 Tax=Paracoccus onubensis TaxID=1675788 RepID=UPI00272F13B0|nr:hypothetical protein [Paracoccus onubensis]MDP0929116.1 hypothetical protein [Paracoccus onubensis]